MHMLYNSDQFVVVAFQVPAEPDTPTPGVAAAGPRLARGGYEIVDKHSGKEIFIEGAVAEHFQRGVKALVDQGQPQEAMDEFIGGYTALAQQPVVLH